MAEKVALVTGASRGIGRAVAMQLIKDGMIVIGTATTEQGAENVSQAIKEAGGKGAGEVLNVNNTDQMQALVQKIGKEYGAPTVLVNNAGITRDNLLMRMKDEEWDAVIDTNLSSIFRLCKMSLRGMMKSRWGRIVNIGSVVGATGNAGQANYAAAKAGLVGFTKSLAKEVGSRNITVNTVAPGFIDTDMTQELPDEQRQALLQSIPLGRLGDVQEIADVVSFLCSDKAGYITGETLHVNGGMYMP